MTLTKPLKFLNLICNTTSDPLALYTHLVPELRPFFSIPREPLDLCINSNSGNLPANKTRSLRWTCKDLILSVAWWRCDCPREIHNVGRSISQWLLEATRVFAMFSPHQGIEHNVLFIAPLSYDAQNTEIWVSGTLARAKDGARVERRLTFWSSLERSIERASSEALCLSSLERWVERGILLDFAQAPVWSARAVLSTLQFFSCVNASTLLTTQFYLGFHTNMPIN